MKLVRIPEDKYYNYRLQAMFDCYKWDPQFCDNNTLAKHVLILTKEENNKVIELTKKLDRETRLAEEYLNKHANIAKKLSLPKKILEQIPNMHNYDNTKNIRLMRYDFHPDINGKWVVTEVNSDVPGGFAESSLLPDATVDLQIITKDRANSIKASLLKQNFKEKNYTVNNKTYTKIFSVVDGKESSAIYQYKINDETYYSVSDFRKTLNEQQTNTFLTIKD